MDQMAANAVEVEWKRVMKFLSAMVAALLAMPGSLMAQAQKMSNEWLTLTPANPRASIERNDRAAVTTSAEDGSTTVSIERRFRNRADSVASMSTLAASKKDRNLRLVVSLDDKKLWVVAGEDTVMEAPVAIGSGDRLVFG
jgi:glucose/arabinose dehydrogenase